MFGSGITISFLIVYLFQIGLLPEQIVTSVSRNFDKTCRRFLYLSLTFFAFNSNWLIISFSGIIGDFVGSILELLYSFLLGTYLIRYIRVEMGIEEKLVINPSLIVYPFLLFNICLQVLNELSLVDQNFIKLAGFTIFQIVTLSIGIKMLVVLLSENNVQKPIFYSSICVVVICIFIPASQFFLRSTALKYLCVNSIHFVLLSSYIIHRYTQLKSESKVLVKHSQMTASFLNEDLTIPREMEVFGKSHGLSPREIEIARMILLNYSTNRIAEELFITQGSVRKHASNIYEKMGITSEVKDKRAHFKNLYSSN